MIQLVSFLAAVGLVLVHLFSGKLRFLDGTPRSAWLSAFGGVSVAYVFVHLLPELASYEETIAAAVGERLPALENHVYLVALVGLAVFYGVERTTASSRQRVSGTAGELGEASVRRAEDAPDTTGGRVFWLSIGSFALYNLLIGYLLLHREQPGVRSLLLFFVAMALHFVVNDFGLRERHKRDFTHIGRWILVAAVALGWVIGLATELSKALVAVLIAFLAGGVVLNVLKEELPEERQSHFWAFALGAVAYTALLLAL